MVNLYHLISHFTRDKRQFKCNQNTAPFSSSLFLNRKTQEYHSAKTGITALPGLSSQRNKKSRGRILQCFTTNMNLLCNFIPLISFPFHCINCSFHPLCKCTYLFFCLYYRLLSFLFGESGRFCFFHPCLLLFLKPVFPDLASCFNLFFLTLISGLHCSPI